MESSEIAGWVVGTPMMGFMVGYFIVWTVKDVKRSKERRKGLKRWKKKNKGK